jgi:hypothetical protein
MLYRTHICYLYDYVWLRIFSTNKFIECKINFISIQKNTYENVFTLLSSSFLLSFVIGISMSLIITWM